VSSLATTDPEIIAVGASTGGPPALRTVLSRLDPEASPPVVLVQHMSADFLLGFAAWLDGVVPPKVEVARSGGPLRRGVVYVAAGDTHLVVSQGRVGLVSRPPVNFQRPSVDVLFQSVAESYGQRAVGILLTGMGRDGAEGLLAMKERGALTISQDEATSLVYGMPRAAAELNAGRIVTNPEHTAQLLRQIATGKRRQKKHGALR
jgi:two-component system chemotaxis response regulator CheB